MLYIYCERKLNGYSYSWLVLLLTSYILLLLLCVKEMVVKLEQQQQQIQHERVLFSDYL